MVRTEPAPQGADPSVGVPNLRDLGGIPTVDGGRVRARLLLRGSSLSRASAADVEVLCDAGVEDVVDLRADWELATAGEVPRAFRTHRLVLVPDAARDETHDVLREGGLQGYYGWIFAHARRELVRLVELVAQAPAALLVQCGAGKDRTGVAIAVLLDLLGVADAEIARDFGRTRDALPAIREGLVRTPGYERAISELPREALGAPPAAILDTLAAVRSDHGSVLAHLADAGLTPTAVTALRARLRTDGGGAQV